MVETMVVFVPIKGGIGSTNSPSRKVVYCQLGDHMPPLPPCTGTKNNHWIKGAKNHHWNNGVASVFCGSPKKWGSTATLFYLVDLLPSNISRKRRHAWWMWLPWYGCAGFTVPRRSYSKPTTYIVMVLHFFGDLISQVIQFFIKPFSRGYTHNSFHLYITGEVDLQDPVCTTSMLGPGSAGIKG